MTQRTPCPEPLERLDVDPRVAVAAWRYPSASEPGRTYDVALAPDGTWSCECWPWLDEDACKHVHDARSRWHARRPCAHRLLATEASLGNQGLVLTRLCVLCGLSYDRAPILDRLRAAIVERYRAKRRAPPSPWTAEERSDDPW